MAYSTIFCISSADNAVLRATYFKPPASNFRTNAKNCTIYLQNRLLPQIHSPLSTCRQYIFSKILPMFIISQNSTPFILGMKKSKPFLIYSIKYNLNYYLIFLIGCLITVFNLLASHFLGSLKYIS